MGGLRHKKCVNSLWACGLQQIKDTILRKKRKTPFSDTSSLLNVRKFTCGRFPSVCRKNGVLAISEDHQFDGHTSLFVFSLVFLKKKKKIDKCKEKKCLARADGVRKKTEVAKMSASVAGSVSICQPSLLDHYR